MRDRQHWLELARLLRAEWHGEGVDAERVRHLADTLLPDNPDMHHTLAHIRQRLLPPSPPH